MVIFAYALESTEVSSSEALQRVIIFYSLAALLVAPLIWVALPQGATVEAGVKSSTAFWADLRQLARNRSLWLAALCMLTGYQLFWATYSLSAYLQSFLGLSAVMVGTFTVAKLWMRPIGATLAGFAGDFWGREEVMAALLVASSLTFIVLTQVPGDLGAFLILGVVLMLGLLTYGIRGIFWATLERAEVDVRLKGLAIGLLSFIGYAPDFYQPWISARLMEAFPGKLGFDLYYWLVASFGVLGALATLRLRRPSVD